jgi:DNA-binding response OmpR family regulator
LLLEACTVDLQTGRIERDGASDALSARQLTVLRALVEADGTPLERDTILPAASSRAVDQTVTRLRRKVEADPRRPRHLLTVHGTGYRFAALAQEVVEAPASEWLVLGPAVIDLGAGTVHLSGVQTTLTAAELAILRALRDQPGGLDRPGLARRALEGGGSPRRVDTLVARLRVKVERVPGEPAYLRTVRGRGYRLDTPVLPNALAAFVVLSDAKVPWDLVAARRIHLAAVTPHVQAGFSDAASAVAFALALGHAAVATGAFHTGPGPDGRAAYRGPVVAELELLLDRCPPGSVALSRSVWEDFEPDVPHARLPTGEVLLHPPPTLPLPPGSVATADAAALAQLRVFQAPFSTAAAEFVLATPDALELLDDLVATGDLRPMSADTLQFAPVPGDPPEDARARHALWCTSGSASEPDFIAALAFARDTPQQAEILAAWADARATSGPTDAVLEAVGRCERPRVCLAVAPVLARVGRADDARRAWERALAMPSLADRARLQLGRWLLPYDPAAAAAVLEPCGLPEAELEWVDARARTGDDSVLPRFQALREVCQRAHDRGAEAAVLHRYADALVRLGRDASEVRASALALDAGMRSAGPNG